jgi:hypothetical protein
MSRIEMGERARGSSYSTGKGGRRKVCKTKERFYLTVWYHLFKKIAFDNI